MMKKAFCVGIYDNGMLLSVVNRNRITAQKYAAGSFIVDGVLIDPEAAAFAIRDFLAANKLKPNSVKLFIKTSKAMSRLSDFPFLNKRDIKALQKQNVRDLFPGSVDGCAICSSVAYSDADKIILYAAAFPEEILNAYIALFYSLKIELTFACMFQELIIKMLDGSENIIAILENHNKSNIILYDSGAPRAIRDLMFSQDSFVKDFENIAEMYSMNDTREFYLFGSRYKPFLSYFTAKGVVHDESNILDEAIIKLNEGSAVNILPPLHKNKLKLNKAIKRSTACMAVIFLLTILMVIPIDRTKFLAAADITALTEELGSEVFIESEAAAQIYADLTKISANIALDYAPVIIYETLLEVFSLLPADMRLNTVSLDSKKAVITLVGVTETDTDLLILSDSLFYSGIFSNIELNEVKRDNSVYHFSMSFSY